MTPVERRRQVVVAGHRGDAQTSSWHTSPTRTPACREAVLGALARIGTLTDAEVSAAFADPAPVVRRRAATLAATRPGVGLLPLLDDPDPTVVEVAAWACGEQERVDDATLGRLIELATEADDALVRESAAAALGAIGDRARPAGDPRRRATTSRTCDAGRCWRWHPSTVRRSTPQSRRHSTIATGRSAKPPKTYAATTDANPSCRA